VSFDVHQGEVVGIIGRNGAGKSTLLKILARVAKPTTGFAEVRGRLGSLLEVGTGFHAELTGRENIFLNGAILGMSKVEIARKFDEIVAFSEVERFIDTPVKHYSSGMQVRLAFSVAAHLEPEILLIDEVLAVGDVAFQKKCLGRMGDVAKQGRTILFVSHNMHAIQQLCSRAVLISQGQVTQDGAVNDCVQEYLRSGRTAATDLGYADLSPSSGVKRRGSGAARFDSAELLSQDGERISELCFGQPVRVRFNIWASRPLRNVLLGFSIIAHDGAELLGTAAHDDGLDCNLHPGIQVYECRVDPMILTPGRYSFRAAIFSHAEEFEHIYEFLPFDVIRAAGGNGNRVPSSHYVGYVYCHYRWQAVVESTPIPAAQP
jgi:lipopolysaccharide transport system ATP-binding protein